MAGVNPLTRAIVEVKKDLQGTDRPAQIRGNAKRVQHLLRLGIDREDKPVTQQDQVIDEEFAP